MNLNHKPLLSSPNFPNNSFTDNPLSISSFLQTNSSLEYPKNQGKIKKIIKNKSEIPKKKDEFRKKIIEDQFLINNFNKENMGIGSRNEKFNNSINESIDKINDSMCQVNKTSKDFTKIFIPFLIEESEDNDNEDNNDLKIGEILLELYQIENTLNKFENCSIYSGIGINDSKNWKFRLKLYNKEYFDVGLLEIRNYLYLYEKHYDFKKNGVAKLRDYFYLNNSLYTITELLGNPLNLLLKKHMSLSLSTVKEIIFKLLKIINNLHEAEIVHLHLNFDSIFYHFNKSNIEINVFDFENARIINKKLKKQYNIDSFSAPELLYDIGISEKADLWSIGCILYELLTGDRLFQADDTRILLLMIKKIFGSNNELDFIKSGGESQKMKELQTKINEIKENLVIIKENKNLDDLFGNLMKINQIQRFSCKEALEHVWFKE